MLRLRGIACLLCVTAVWCIGWCGPVVRAAERPNVLFIAVDDLRVELGCYGNTAVRSPNIDRLADRGTLFERAYCQQAVCNPSRASLLTGMRPDSLRVWDLPTHFRQNRPELITLPQHFKRHGYHTRNIGKVFHNWRQDDYRGDPASWSVPAEMHYANHGSDKPVVRGKLPPNESKVPKTTILDVPDEAYFDGRIAERAVDALAELADRPFFLAVGFWKPHSPFNAPKRYWDLYRRDEITPPQNPQPPSGVPDIAMHDSREMLGAFKSRPNGRPTDAEALALRHGYYAATSYVDAQIGKLLDELDRLDLWKNTIVVFWSDHGYHLGEHALWAKTSNFELDARVPLIIATPEHAHGQRTQAIVELLDLYPTLADLCDLPVPSELEGTSLRPALEQPTATVKSAALTQHTRPAYPSDDDPLAAMGYSLRTDRFRYTEWRAVDDGRVLARELYDHQADPGETSNAAGDAGHAAAVEKLAAQLDEFIAAPVTELSATRPDARPAEPAITLTATLDFGEDRGQNYGTLFELSDAQGNALAGAGFLGAYNTFVRSDRTALNVFVRPSDPRPTIERLPKPNRDSGAYLFEQGGGLFAVTAASDTALRRWNPEKNTWFDDTGTPRLTTAVAGGHLRVADNRILFQDRTVLVLGTDGGTLGRHYFANNFLLFREVRPLDDERPSRLHAVAWRPDQPGVARLAESVSLDLPWNGEFVYAFGQLGADVLVATNTGGVYRFDGEAWEVMIPPDRNVSFQIYAMLNYYDRLLMGQYPTGELFEYDGKEIRRLEGWPPVMPGVSSAAREAQTLAIYGGDLIAGVWPWAEVWRYNRGDDSWHFVDRMFTHPDLTEEFTHPYEQETAKRSPVANLWGQRVTSLVPLGASLYVGTSAKSSTQPDEKFDFLSPAQRAQYGSVLRLTQPGNLSVGIDPTRRPTTLRVRLSSGRMAVKQDGKLLGEAALPPALFDRLQGATITWGHGVYGALVAERLSQSVSGPGGYGLREAR